MNYSHLSMPTREALYDFLKSNYLHQRFEGRNNASWGTDYSKCVTESAYRDLEENGYALISHHSSNSREALFYLRSLEAFDTMTKLCAHACGSPEAICIRAIIPENLAPQHIDKSLSERLAKLNRDIMGTFPLCRVELSFGTGNVLVEVSQASALIAKEINGFTHTIITRWSEGY